MDYNIVLERNIKNCKDALSYLRDRFATKIEEKTDGDEEFRAICIAIEAIQKYEPICADAKGDRFIRYYCPTCRTEVRHNIDIDDPITVCERCHQRIYVQGKNK